jgi:ribosome-associated protein
VSEDEGFVVDGTFVSVDEVQWKFSTSGGPGGQHANRSNTAATATFDIAASAALPASLKDRLIPKLGRVVTLHCDAHRSQTRNREEAVERIEQRLSDALVTKKRRRKTKPTRGSKRRRVDAKRRRGETKKLRQRPTDD